MDFFEGIVIDGMVIVFRIGLINNNKIDNWINQNVATLVETCFGILLKDLDSGRYLRLVNCMSCVNLFSLFCELSSLKIYLSADKYV